MYKEKTTVQIPTNLIFDDRFTPREVSVFMAFQLHRYVCFEECHVNPKIFMSEVCRRELTPAEIKGLSDDIQHLIDLGYLKGIKHKKDYYIVDTESLIYTTGISYAIIRVKDYLKIMRSRRKDKYALVRYYCAIVSKINTTMEVSGHKGIAGTCSMEFFAYKLKCDKSTIMSYNKILEQMKLIFVARKKNKQNKLINDKNMYCLYEYKDEIIRAYNYQTEEQHQLSNHHRKLAAMYNAMQQGKEYDATTTKEILTYINSRS